MLTRQYILIVGTLLVGLVSTATADRPVKIFDGNDLSGWTRRGGAAKYTVENGEIVGRSVPNTGNTFLCTDEEFGDFELELDFKIDDPTFNSGVQIRSHGRPEGDGERVYGYQVEIDPRKDRKWSAGLYFEAGSEHRPAGWLNDLENNEPAREAFKLGEWNHLRVVAKDRHIQTWLNGVPAADYTDTDDQAFTPRGFIGLQVHSVGGAEEPKEVRWKNLKLVVFDDGQNAAN